ncbi:MAG: hypothetical protein RRY54_05945 [Angelakisella sp.]
MLLKLFSEFAGTAPMKEAENKVSLRTLEVAVRAEMERTEELFNATEDAALMDSAIYKLKSLSAYQEYLLRSIREDELGNTDGFIIEGAHQKFISGEELAMG